MSKPISRENSGRQVLEYAPPKLDLGIPEAAMDLAERSKATRFKLSELTRDQTGLSRLEAEEFERQVEQKVVDRLKDIEEAAYKEAFELGLIEGRKQSFDSNSSAIDEALAKLTHTTESLENMKKELLAYNEAHLIRLCFAMAERLAAHEVAVNPEASFQILRQAVEIAQSEEEILVRVAPEQVEFFETLKKETGRDFEFLKKLKFDGDPSVIGGGCILQTNYGEIDSRLDQRVEQLWESIKDTLVRVKPELKSVS